MTLKILLFFTNLIIICFATRTSAQFKAIAISQNDLPGTIEVKGRFMEALKWTDHSGTHLVITSETGEVDAKNAPDNSYREAALYAVHYIIKGDSIKMTWKLYDFVEECPVDIKAQFIPKTFAVTDIDHNGEAEVWMMYSTVCRGDVSPALLKIVMYEKGRKHIIRGTTRVQLRPKTYNGGSYTLDNAFRQSPSAIRQYAIDLWKHHKDETW